MPEAGHDVLGLHPHPGGLIGRAHSLMTAVKGHPSRGAARQQHHSCKSGHRCQGQRLYGSAPDHGLARHHASGDQHSRHRQPLRDVVQSDRERHQHPLLQQSSHSSTHLFKVTTNSMWRVVLHPPRWSQQMCAVCCDDGRGKRTAAIISYPGRAPVPRRRRRRRRRPPPVACCHDARDTGNTAATSFSPGPSPGGRRRRRRRRRPPPGRARP